MLYEITSMLNFRVPLKRGKDKRRGTKENAYNIKKHNFGNSCLSFKRKMREVCTLKNRNCPKFSMR